MFAAGRTGQLCSAPGCSKTAHRGRVKEGRRSCCTHTHLCKNTSTHTDKRMGPFLLLVYSLHYKCDSKKSWHNSGFMNIRLHKSCVRDVWSIRDTWRCLKVVQEDFFVPLLAFCCKMMNSRMSLAVRLGLSITTEWPQFSSRSTLHLGNTSAMTVAPETSTTCTNTGHLILRLCLWRCETEVSLSKH